MASSLPFVSIVIPTYNRAASYFPLALKSAVSQSYPAIEVIVCDNASEDHTSEIALAMGDPRIRYLRHPRNIGPYQNWSHGLEQARGDYILLLHDDDLIDADFVECCLRAANFGTRAGVIRTGTRVIDAEGRTLWQTANRVKDLPLEEFFRAWFAGKTAWFMVSTLFQTKALRALGGFHSQYQMLQDGVAIALLAGRCGRADVEEVKASYRKHPLELTFAHTATLWAKDFLCLLDLLCELTPPAQREDLRRQGMRFFARLSFDRAAAIASPLDRMRAYRELWGLFTLRYFPLARLLGLDALRSAARRARAEAGKTSIGRTLKQSLRPQG
jgi:glycosyltransferase involved in cell wall biosynthesis